MKAIVTGASGTVGRALTAELTAAGHKTIAWDRAAVHVDDYLAMEDFVRREAPDAIFHLAIPSRPTGRDNEDWLVSWHWPSELAWIARVVGVRFVYASTVLVWTDRTPGPYMVTTPADAADGYGGGKVRTEERVWSQNPAARVARLGWQIGDAPGTNNMIDFFHKRMAEDGVVRASRKWMPACSLLADTARGLIRVAESDPGLYLVNSNRDMNFHEIATALAARHKGAWRVEATDDYTHDQRMLDERVGMPSLRERLAK